MGDTQVLEISPRRSVLPGPNSIEPFIRGDEVTTRIPHHRHIELLHGLDDILAEAILIRQLVAWVVDAAVYAAAHVLCEATVDIVVNLGDDEARVDGDGGTLLVADFGVGRHVGGRGGWLVRVSTMILV